MTLPALVCQLDNGTGTASVDCAVMTVINAAQWASGGRAGPQRHQDIPLYVHQVRAIAGNMHEGLLFRGDTLEVYQSSAFRKWFSRTGVTPPRVEYRQRVSWSTVRDRLRRGDFVHLPVDYGEVNDGIGPSGSLSFRGQHSIGLAQAWYRGRVLKCHVADPLFDGRTRWVGIRGWHRYPKGWQIASVSSYRAAAGAWGKPEVGDGFATAIFITRR